LSGAAPRRRQLWLGIPRIEIKDKKEEIWKQILSFSQTEKQLTVTVT
jgi:hypothetical protein